MTNARRRKAVARGGGSRYLGGVMVRSLQPMKLGSATAAALAGIALLTVYCQIMPGEGPTPLGVSVSWAIVTLFSWAGFGVVIWSLRGRLLDMVASSEPARVAMAAAIVLGLASITVVVGYAVSIAPFEIALPLSRFRDRLIELAPNMLLLTGGVTAALAAKARMSGPGRDPGPAGLPASAPDVIDRSRDDWIRFPHDPHLRIRATDIAIVRAAGNYCAFEAYGREHLLRCTAQSMERHLAEHGFVRVSRSLIVNARRVRMSAKADAGRLRLMLDDGASVVVSKGYRRQLEETLPRFGPTRALVDQPRPS